MSLTIAPRSPSLSLPLPHSPTLSRPSDMKERNSVIAGFRHFRYLTNVASALSVFSREFIRGKLRTNVYGIRLRLGSLKRLI
jgi:hypothetical protein